MPRLLALGLLCAALLNLSPKTFAGNDPPPASNYLWGFYFSTFTLTASAPGPVYHVIGDMFIQPGVTMTIEPGVTLEFAANHDTLNGSDYFNDSEIVCEGNLIAVGTPTDSILFTSDRATGGLVNDWGQIKVLNSGSGVFRYCEIAYATRGVEKTGANSLSIENCNIRNVRNAVRCTGGDIAIRNSKINGCSNDDGITVNGAASLLCEYNVITNVDDIGIKCEATNLSIIRFNQISYTANKGIYCSGSNALIHFNHISNSMLYGIVLNSHSVPVVVLGDTVDNVVNAHLGSGIYLSSGVPDTIRNCLVHDLDGSGIKVQANDAVIENCLIHHASGDYFSNGGVYVQANGVKIRYCTIASCSSGIFYWGDATVKNNIIVNNDPFAIYWYTGNPLVYSYSDIWNNANVSTGNTTCSGGCYSINPWFVDNDYHLASNSPLRVLGEGGTQIGRYGPDPGDVTGIGPGETYPPAYLLPNSPNPFSRSTILSFLSREEGDAHIEVFDLSGRRMKDFHLQAQQGLNEIPLVRDNLGAGLYFYRVSLPGFTETRKLVVTN